MQPKAAPGLTLHSAWWYDLTVRLFTLGRERAFRKRILEPAQLKVGEAVLDVGCGTGSLALLAKKEVGTQGEVHGIDASPEMIGRARQKAKEAGADVRFDVAPAQSLPFSDRTFDVVLSTLMFHHLPRPSREQLACEIRRVLKPGGRVLVVDFAKGKKRRGIFGWIHASHGSTKPSDMEAPLAAAGFGVAISAPLGTKDLHYVLARAPGANGGITRPPEHVAGPTIEPVRTRSARHALLLVALLSVLLTLHLGAATAIFGVVRFTSWPLIVAAAVIAGAVLLKIAIVRRLRVRWRRHPGCRPSPRIARRPHRR